MSVNRFLISNGIDTFSVSSNLDSNSNLKTNSQGDIESVPQLSISDIATLQTTLDDKLIKTNNLSDLTDVSIARSSLGLGSILNDISDIKTLNTAQSTSITAIETKNTQQDTSISNINTSITNIETKNTSQDTSISNINTSITGIESKNLSQDTSISNINTSISGIESKNTAQDVAIATKMTKVVSTDTAIPIFNGITGEVKNSSVLVDASSNVSGINKLSLTGVLQPVKLTTTQRDLLTPVQGDIIYNTTTNNQEIYDGLVWSSGLEANSQSGTISTGIYTGTAVAISLRKVNSAYTGSCCQIRRTDNLTAEIGFDANGILDKTAFDAHCGIGNPGWISIWYDQSGNGADFKAHENVTSRQALILWSTINGVQNIPEAQFNGLSLGTSYTCVKNVGQMSLTNGSALAFQTTFKMTAINTLSFLYSSNADNYFEALHNSGTQCTTSMNGVAKVFTTPNVLNTGYKRWVSYHSEGKTNVRVDSVNNTGLTDTINTAGTTLVISLGCRASTGSWRFQGTLNEFIIYSKKISDTLLANIEQDEKDLWVDANLASNATVSYVNTYDLLNVNNNLKLTSTQESTAVTNGALVVQSAGIASNLNVGGKVVMTSTTNGFKINSLTTAQRDALTPEHGLIIFNSQVGVVQFYLGIIGGLTNGWKTLAFSA